MNQVQNNALQQLTSWLIKNHTLFVKRAIRGNNGSIFQLFIVQMGISPTGQIDDAYKSKTFYMTSLLREYRDGEAVDLNVDTAGGMFFESNTALNEFIDDLSEAIFHKRGMLDIEFV